jgi:hypothetical protein
MHDLKHGDTNYADDDASSGFVTLCEPTPCQFLEVADSAIRFRLLILDCVKNTLLYIGKYKFTEQMTAALCVR